jgi:hypothetical protein
MKRYCRVKETKSDDMRYADGQDIRIGDIVSVGPSGDGGVVCIITDGVYTDDYPEADWGYLGKGFMANFKAYGLIYYETPEADLKLISRAP